MPPPESIEDLNRRIHAWWAVFLVGVPVLISEIPLINSLSTATAGQGRLQCHGIIVFHTRGGCCQRHSHRNLAVSPSLVML